MSAGGGDTGAAGAPAAAPAAAGAGEARKTAFPVTRVWRIMKQDDQVNMLSAEPPVMLEQLCERLSRDLARAAGRITEAHGRRVVTKDDLVEAVRASDMYDFLIDIVAPVDEDEDDDFIDAIDPMDDSGDLEGV